MPSDTTRAAIVRGLYNAAGMFLVTFLVTLSQVPDTRSAAIVGGIAALGALGFRAGGEGAYDTYRQRHGLTEPGDVRSK